MADAVAKETPNRMPKNAPSGILVERSICPIPKYMKIAISKAMSGARARTESPQRRKELGVGLEPLGERCKCEGFEHIVDHPK